MRLRRLSLSIQENIMGSISAESGHSKIDKLWYEVDPYKVSEGSEVHRVGVPHIILC